MVAEASGWEPTPQHPRKGPELPLSCGVRAAKVALSRWLAGSHISGMLAGAAKPASTRTKPRGSRAPSLAGRCGRPERSGIVFIKEGSKGHTPANAAPVPGVLAQRGASTQVCRASRYISFSDTQQ